MKPIYTAKTPVQKAEQRALLQYFKPENRELVLQTLKRYGRSDLIGNGKECLVQDTRQPNRTTKKPLAKKKTIRNTRPKKKQ